MQEDSYPNSEAWYPSLVDPSWPTHGTAADIVWTHFDIHSLAPLEPLYQEARAKLRREKKRITQIKEQYGWDDPVSGQRRICPLLLQAQLRVLPDAEPLAATGAGGRPPFPFLAYLRAWLWAPFYEVEDNAAALWRALANNPRFLERCEFPGHQLPTQRSFQRFNEVMNHAGLWGKARILAIRTNLDNGVLSPPRSLSIDPGHLDGCAALSKKSAACRSCQGCLPEEQVRTCDVTDLLTKKKNYQFVAVKGVFIGDSDNDIPYAALAVNARKYDGKTGARTAQAFAEDFPELADGIDEALLDGAFDIQDEKTGISEVFGDADVLTPINPRRRKDKPVLGARGIAHIDKYGVPHCIAGEPMAYHGRDLKREDYLFGCPRFDAKTKTLDCPHQGRCCPNPGHSGRRYRVAREETPQVDWKIPQHSAEFKERYNKRTSIERIIGRTKRSFPFERHWGRGKASLQGHLDKGVLAFHVLASAAHAAGMPHKFRSPLQFQDLPKKPPS